MLRCGAGGGGQKFDQDMIRAFVLSKIKSIDMIHQVTQKQLVCPISSDVLLMDL